MAQSKKNPQKMIAQSLENKKQKKINKTKQKKRQNGDQVLNQQIAKM